MASSGNNFIFYVLALLTGALIPIQAATNTVFSKAIGNTFVTGLTVFAMGLLSMAIVMLVTKTPLPTVNKLSAAPVYSYLGGLIIAVYVVVITIITPKIGVGSAIGLIVTGQILCAVLIDHFGLFHVAVRPADIKRIAGVLMMIGGIYLVMSKSK
ncbi:MAG: DMT family transporter [Bacteroidetes bacterium]|nr:DMT family transporter [Bacteroidota bacterium]